MPPFQLLCIWIQQYDKIEGGFWLWTGGIASVYDGKNLGCFGSVFGICIYLQC